MMVDFFKGSGKKPISKMFNYLLGENRDRKHARLLLGDIDLSKKIIHQFDSENKYTAGCLSFEESNILESQKYELMSSFEKSILSGLDADQYNIVWIEHRDKNRLELNFVIANQELRTGKRLQPYWDGVDRPLVENWKLVQNAKYGFTEPKDPIKAKPVAHSNESSKTIDQVREHATRLVLDAHKNGELQSRNDVLSLLKSNGYEIERQVKKSISLKNPFNPKGMNIRLSGRLFDSEYNGSLVDAELIQKHAENLAKAQERLSKALEIKRNENHQKYGSSIIPGAEFISELLEHSSYEADKRISSSIQFDDERIKKLTHELSRSDIEFRNRKQLSNSRESDIERTKQAIAESKQAIEQSKQKIERVPDCIDVKRTREKDHLNHLSQEYWRFERFYNNRVNQRDAAIHELEDRFNKSQKWLNKKNFDEDYIDQYNMSVPDFYIKKYLFNTYVKEENENFKNDVVQRVYRDKIKDVISEIRSVANKLDVVEPYKVERTGFQKLKVWVGTKVGIKEQEKTILDDLTEYDKYVSPFVISHEKAEEEKYRELVANKKFEERKKVEQQKRKDELERQRLENDLKLQEHLDREIEAFRNTPKPEKPIYQQIEPEPSKRDDSLDFGM